VIRGPQSVGGRSLISAFSVRNEPPELCHIRRKSMCPTLKAVGPLWPIYFRNHLRQLKWRECLRSNVIGCGRGRPFVIVIGGARPVPPQPDMNVKHVDNQHYWDEQDLRETSVASRVGSAQPHVKALPPTACRARSVRATSKCQPPRGFVLGEADAGLLVQT
jgi:hypothetical protein